MGDVRRLLGILLGLHAVTLLGSSCSRRRRGRATCARSALRAGSFVTFGLCALVGLLLAVNPVWFMTGFHTIFFEGSSWRFADDRDAAPPLSRPLLERHGAPARRRSPLLQAVAVACGAALAGAPEEDPGPRGELARRWPDGPRRRSTRRSTSSSRGPRRRCRRRADEARPRAAPLPRQVRPAARRGLPRAATSRPGDRVYDPFAGSGTTLVEANAFGADAIGCDISAFNCLLDAGEDGALLARRARARPARCARGGAARRAGRATRDAVARSEWFAPRALGELLAYRAAARAAAEPPRRSPRVVLARAARSARLTTHFDLDFPAAPRPSPTTASSTSARAVRRRRRRSSSPATRDDTIRRIRAFAALRTRAHGRGAARRRAHRATARARPTASSPRRRTRADRLPRAAPLRLRAARPRRPSRGGDRRRRRRRARARGRAYVEAMSAAFANTRGPARAGRPVLIVVNDSKELYPRILDARGPRARGADHAPRQPAHRPARRRVLRGRPDLPPGVTPAAARSARRLASGARVAQQEAAGRETGTLPAPTPKTAMFSQSTTSR